MQQKEGAFTKEMLDDCHVDVDECTTYDYVHLVTEDQKKDMTAFWD